MQPNRARRIGIVGGGAAGLITGLTLRALPNAPEVVIFEREKAPYTTLCGEGISERALNAFKAFDSMPHTTERFPGAEWHWPGGIKVEIDQPCFSLERATWIPAMADAFREGGGDYRTNEKVDAKDLASMREEFDLVVGADGPGSMVAKSIGATHSTSLGIQYRMSREGFEGDRLEFYTDKRFSPEYAWVFPKGEILNVGLLASGDGKDWDRLDDFMQWRGLEGKVLKREAYPIGFNGRKRQERNVVLVGDAGGLTNPVTKGGLAAIIYAANILGDLVGRGLHARYGSVIEKHPIASPLFQRAEDTILRWTNADFERVARFAPPVMRVNSDRSTYVAYALQIAATVALTPTLARDLLVIARAMGLSKDWSW